MELLPKCNSLRVHCLSNSGVFSKIVSVENFIPMAFHDYRARSLYSLLGYPQFIDNEMIYYNDFQKEFYIFDKEGVWEEENINHESLDANKLMDEKKWFDHLRGRT